MARRPAVKRTIFFMVYKWMNKNRKEKGSLGCLSVKAAIIRVLDIKMGHLPKKQCPERIRALSIKQTRMANQGYG
jgi:hypothetical protein